MSTDSGNTGAVAVIVGAGGALGSACAVEFALRGDCCVLAGPTRERLEQTAARVAEVGGEAIVVEADAGEKSDIEGVFAHCHELFGACDALVHAAAIQGPTAPVGEVTEAEWDEVMRVNLRSAFLCSRGAVADMVPQGRGSIVLVSSADALRGFPMTTPYATSKAGLIGLARALSAEVSGHGVRVNVLSPGPIPEAAIYQTAIGGIAGRLGIEPDELMGSVTGAAGADRRFTAKQMAGGAVFLTSPASEAMTGQILVMDALPG